MWSADKNYKMKYERFIPEWKVLHRIDNLRNDYGRRCKLRAVSHWNGVKTELQLAVTHRVAYSANLSLEDVVVLQRVLAEWVETEVKRLKEEKEEKERQNILDALGIRETSAEAS